MQKKNNKSNGLPLTQRQENSHAGAPLVSNASHHHVRILFKEKNDFMAIVNQSEVSLSTAMSCLVQPQIGDLVLVSISQDSEQGYILSILERAGEASDTEMTFPGNVSITSLNGDVSIEAKSQVKLGANKKITLEAQNIESNAEKSICNSGELILSGEKLQAKYNNIYWSCKDTFFVQTLKYQLHSKNSLRQITGHEETLTGSFRQYVENNWTLHTRSTAMYADETTSIKAEMLKLA